MKKSNYIVHDCETGGLDPTKNPITQYACVILDYKTLKEVDRFETYVKPYNDLTIEKSALEATMVTMSDIKSGMNHHEFVKAVIDFWEQHRAAGNKEMGRLVSVGQNIPFDHGFLDYVLQLEGKTIWNYFQPNFVDTYCLAKMAWGLTGTEKLDLGANCERAKIRLTDAHGAMNDVEATADLFRWFVKKVRAKKGDAVVGETSGRARGTEFFEFKCGAK